MPIEDYEIDGSLAGLSEEEIEAKIAAEITENNMGVMEKLRRDNPTLHDAWEQIKTIRGLTEEQQTQENTKPAWERHYFEVVDSVETDNVQLQDAWNKYYMLKNLITAGNRT